jgi:hypothetical protein
MGDFGWAAATPPVQRLAGLALPGAVVPGSTTRLLLAAGGQDATVTVTTGGGAQARQVTVQADHSVVLDLGRAKAVWVQPRSGAVQAAVSISGVLDNVPVLSIVPLAEAPVTAVTVPVRQVGN